MYVCIYVYMYMYVYIIYIYIYLYIYIYMGRGGEATPPADGPLAPLSRSAGPPQRKSPFPPVVQVV